MRARVQAAAGAALVFVSFAMERWAFLLRGRGRVLLFQAARP